jgi:hypothetical protein
MHSKEDSSEKKSYTYGGQLKQHRKPPPPPPTPKNSTFDYESKNANDDSSSYTATVSLKQTKTQISHQTENNSMTESQVFMHFYFIIEKKFSI